MKRQISYLKHKPILLIQTGHAKAVSQDLVSRFGDSDTWFKRALKLGSAEEDETIKVCAVCDNEKLPDIKEVEENYSGILITGSPSYVTSKEYWSVKTGEWLKQLSQRNKTYILGVCYGHQLLADCLGGTVKDNPNGPTFGTMKIKLNSQEIISDKLFSVFAREELILGHVSHRQSVLIPPSNSIILGSNDTDPNHIIRFSNKVWGVQYHPEFDKELALMHVTLRQEYIVRTFGVSKYTEFVNSIKSHDFGTRLLQRYVDIITGSDESMKSHL